MFVTECATPSLIVFCMVAPSIEYYVITFRRVHHPGQWTWEIRRKCTPLGIKMMATGYPSHIAAKVAGKEALADFLFHLSREEKRSRKQDG